MHAFLEAAADLLLGAACPGCGAPGWGLCHLCAARLDAPVRLVDRDVGVPVAAAGPYRPVLCHVIPRFKDDGALHLTGELAGLLARAVAVLEPPEASVLVPVPSRPSAVRERGYDHAARLSRAAARRCGLAQARLLARRDQGSDQSVLGRSGRAANLDGAMTALWEPRPVLLVDDITTTGASLREAVRAVAAAGGRVVGAAVIADADYR